MPHPEMERLSQDSEKAQVDAAVSACIAAEVRAGREQDQAVAMCMGMARDKTGGRPPKGGA